MLYLAIFYFSTSAFLVRERDRTQQLIYYCSRALRGVEERYPKMEKLILALVTTAKILRPYFQAHNIEIPTEHPMKQTLHKPETFGRLVKWAIELSSSTLDTSQEQQSKGKFLQISSWNSPRQSLPKTPNSHLTSPSRGCPWMGPPMPTEVEQA